ncbi:MAG TPA: hypothetical protein VGG72_21450 [Bryobacteraceae bacterium]|jgi:hypothetical protein
MDKDSQTLFDELMRKAPHELRESDIQFLKARESYLTADQRAVFGEVLGLTEGSAKEEEKSDKPKKK